MVGEADRIIGGVAANRKSWPWIVGITEKGKRYCAGTLIHDRWVVSAEHCFDHIRTENGHIVRTSLIFLGLY